MVDTKFCSGFANKSLSSDLNDFDRCLKHFPNWKNNLLNVRCKEDCIKDLLKPSLYAQKRDENSKH